MPLRELRPPQEAIGPVSSNTCSSASAPRLIRIGIDATKHEEEVAREPLAGQYVFDPVVRSWSFAGTSNTVTGNLTGEQAALSGNHHIYRMVNPTCYTGVTLTIRTDRDSYIYADGTMDVAQRDAPATVSTFARRAGGP